MQSIHDVSEIDATPLAGLDLVEAVLIFELERCCFSNDTDGDVR
jgi:hypothetical protein